MELSWSNFILEMINFLVLVWILKHFFYKPIQQVIIKRRQSTQETLDKAQEQFIQAKKMQSDYENRLKDWDVEKEQKRKRYQQDMEEWKAKETAKFQKYLEKEQEKMTARQKQKSAQEIQKNAKIAWEKASLFASKLLSNFADASLEEKLIIKTLADLKDTSAHRFETLKGLTQEDKSIAVETAYPLTEALKKKITQALQKLLDDKAISLDFKENPQLLAGLNISIGAYSLQANLRDELKFFAEIENGKH